MARYATDEPIYALATPYSPSALAVIRASGCGVLSMIAPYFSASILDRPSLSATHGYITDKDGSLIDEVVAIKYGKGHGYTSEEAFEIMCHGSLPVIRRISRLLEGIGIREAERGEFTYRAFMHGRLDLTAAEAVEEIVSARSERAGAEALSRLSGSIRKEAEAAKAEINESVTATSATTAAADTNAVEDTTTTTDEEQGKNTSNAQTKAKAKAKAKAKPASKRHLIEEDELKQFGNTQQRDAYANAVADIAEKIGKSICDSCKGEVRHLGYARSLK